MLAQGPSRQSNNAPLGHGKGTLYEGGIRVPFIVRWPGTVAPGSTSAAQVSSVDFYPTILEVAGTVDKPGHVVDGVSLVPLLNGQGTLEDLALFWHYPHYHHTAPGGAVRAGDYKLIEYYEDGMLELYNLRDDLGESKNLARQLPEKTLGTSANPGRVAQVRRCSDADAQPRLRSRESGIPQPGGGEARPA